MTIGTTGDVIPLINIGKRLQILGHKITFITHYELLKHVPDTMYKLGL